MKKSTMLGLLVVALVTLGVGTALAFADEGGKTPSPGLGSETQAAGPAPVTSQDNTAAPTDNTATESISSTIDKCTDDCADGAVADDCTAACTDDCAATECLDPSAEVAEESADDCSEGD